MHWPAKITPRLSWWDGKWRSLLFDLGVAFVGVSFGVWNDKYATPGYLALFVIAGAVFTVRRRWPWLPVMASVGLSFVNPVAVAATVAVYTMARRRGPVLSTWIAAVVIAGLFISLMSRADSPLGGPLGLVLLIVVNVVAAGVPTLLGLWVYQRYALMNSLRDRAEAAERERALLAERAVTAERRRIAREMHDVVAHRVSVISLQAGALTVTATDDTVADTAEVIRRTSADALTELRQMLNVLRDAGDPEASTEPGAVTLEHIDGLVADAVAAGANVRLDRPDRLPEVSGEVGRAAYRVVQEALTNAGKHAPHAAVRVTLATGDDGLRVCVANRRGAGEAATSVPGAGFGLIGMRERVTLVGDALRTGPDEDGGYRVEAVFPLGPDEEVV